ncbi:MAG: hypothetical protein LAT68_16105, partial [Cyclobacteriaceae bacterium]|nr:hypothetical protein [Cyclobacteriaceae bacterium]
TNDMDIFFVDTPGPNNSQNNRHKEATYTYLKDEEKKPILIYILNATQLRTNDELHTLNEISKFLKKNKSSNDRIIFVLNRIDDLDPEKEPLNEVISKTKQYLKDNFEISNPKIFPVSAEYARIAVKASKHEELSRNEKNNLLKFQKAFKPDIEDNYSGVATFNYLPVPLGLKQKIKNKIGEVEWKDDLIYSGLYGLKQYIQYYIKHQQKNDTTHTVFEILKEVTENIDSKIDIELDTKSYEDKLREYEIFKNEQVQLIKEKFGDMESEVKDIKPDISFAQEMLNELTQKHSNIQSYLGGKYKLEESEAKGIEKQVSNDVISIRTSFGANMNKSLNDYIMSLKQLMKSKYRLTDEMNQFERSVNKDLSLSVSSIDPNSIDISAFKKESTHIIDNTRFWNPFSWFGLQDKKITKTFYSASDIVNNFVDPLFHPLRKEIDTSKQSIFQSSKYIQEKIVRDLKDEMNRSLNKVYSDFEKKKNETEKEQEEIKNDYRRLKHELNSNFNKIKV